MSNEQVILMYPVYIVVMGETKEEVINATSKFINGIKKLDYM